MYVNANDRVYHFSFALGFAVMSRYESGAYGCSVILLKFSAIEFAQFHVLHATIVMSGTTQLAFEILSILFTFPIFIFLL